MEKDFAVMDLQAASRSFELILSQSILNSVKAFGIKLSYTDASHGL